MFLLLMDSRSKTAQFVSLRDDQHGYYGRQTPRPVYGIIVVGRYVRFYRYNDETQSTISLLNQNDGRYHIKRQCTTVQARLDYIRDNPSLRVINFSSACQV